MQRLPNLSESIKNPQEKNISEPLALVKENWHFKLEKVFLIPSSPSNDDCEYRSGKPNGRIQIRYLGQKSNHPSNNKEEGGGGKHHIRWLFTEVLSVMAKKKKKKGNNLNIHQRGLGKLWNIHTEKF